MFKIPNLFTPKQSSKTCYNQYYHQQGKGQAMQASRNICRGELILSEEPLLELPPIPPSALSKDFLSDSMATTNDRNGQTMLETYLAKQPKIVVQKLEKLHGEAAIRGEDADDSDEDDAANTKYARTMMAKALKNAFTHVEEKDGTEYGTTRVFEVISRFNHSCRPNAVVERDPDLGKATVHALMDINASNDIENDYLRDAKSTLKTRDQRRDELEPTYGFRCACTAYGPSGRQDGLDRAEARKLYKEIDFEPQIGNEVKNLTTEMYNKYKRQLEILTQYIDLLNKLMLNDAKLKEAYEARAKYHNQAVEFSSAKAVHHRTKRFREMENMEEPCEHMWLAIEDLERARDVSTWVHGSKHQETLGLSSHINDMRGEALKSGSHWLAR